MKLSLCKNILLQMTFSLSLMAVSSPLVHAMDPDDRESLPSSHTFAGKSTLEGKNTKQNWAPLPRAFFSDLEEGGKTLKEIYHKVANIEEQEMKNYVGFDIKKKDFPTIKEMFFLAQKKHTENEELIFKNYKTLKEELKKSRSLPPIKSACPPFLEDIENEVQEQINNPFMRNFFLIYCRDVHVRSALYEWQQRCSKLSSPSSFLTDIEKALWALSVYEQELSEPFQWLTTNLLLEPLSQSKFSYKPKYQDARIQGYEVKIDYVSLYFLCRKEATHLLNVLRTFSNATEVFVGSKKYMGLLKECLLDFANKTCEAVLNPKGKLSKFRQNTKEHQGNLADLGVNFLQYPIKYYRALCVFKKVLEILMTEQWGAFTFKGRDETGNLYSISLSDKEREKNAKIMIDKLYQRDLEKNTLPSKKKKNKKKNQNKNQKKTKDILPAKKETFEKPKRNITSEIPQPLNKDQHHPNPPFQIINANTSCSQNVLQQNSSLRSLSSPIQVQQPGDISREAENTKKSFMTPKDINNNSLLTEESENEKETPYRSIEKNLNNLLKELPSPGHGSFEPYRAVYSEILRARQLNNIPEDQQWGYIEKIRDSIERIKEAENTKKSFMTPEDINNNSLLTKKSENEKEIEKERPIDHLNNFLKELPSPDHGSFESYRSLYFEILRACHLNKLNNIPEDQQWGYIEKIRDSIERIKGNKTNIPQKDVPKTIEPLFTYIMLTPIRYLTHFTMLDLRKLCKGLTIMLDTSGEGARVKLLSSLSSEEKTIGFHIHDKTKGLIERGIIISLRKFFTDLGWK